MSQKTTFPPRCSTTFAVEIHVNAGTMASSPGLKFNAAKDKWSALVQDETAIDSLTSTNSENQDFRQ